MNFLQNHIESIIFCATDPVKPDEIRQCMSEMFEAEIPLDDILNAVDELLSKYEDEMYPFQILQIGGGYQFMTKPAYQSSLGIFLKQKSKKRLSTSALETMAIVAYKQPITKGQIEQIRGVNCDYAMQKLLEKELVEIQGKSDGVGRPILYGTSQKFLEYFGINNIKDLPSPKDFTSEVNEIGDVNDPEYNALASQAISEITGQVNQLEIIEASQEIEEDDDDFQDEEIEDMPEDISEVSPDNSDSSESEEDTSTENDQTKSE
jgi:segregation and condensation protein B